VFNIAGALPFSIAPALANTMLAIGGGSYGVLYALAGACAIIGGAAVASRQARPLTPTSRS